MLFSNTILKRLLTAFSYRAIIVSSQRNAVRMNMSYSYRKENKTMMVTMKKSMKSSMKPSPVFKPVVSFVAPFVRSPRFMETENSWCSSIMRPSEMGG